MDTTLLCLPWPALRSLYNCGHRPTVHTCIPLCPWSMETGGKVLMQATLWVWVGSGKLCSHQIRNVSIFTVCTFYMQYPHKIKMLLLYNIKDGICFYLPNADPWLEFLTGHLKLRSLTLGALSWGNEADVIMHWMKGNDTLTSPSSSRAHVCR